MTLLSGACGGHESPSTPSSVTTPPVTPPVTTQAAPPPVVPDAILVGAGDIAQCWSDGARQTAALLDAMDGLIFTAGDNVYMNGTPDEFRDCYGPTWGRHVGRTRPAPGNHDYGYNAGAGYYAFFGAVAAPAAPGFYSYDVGAWHVVSLNSNIAVDAGSAQVSWLRRDLAGSTAKCTLAVFHHPLFSSADHGGSAWTRDLWRALYDGNVEVIVNGHEHVYERFAPQTPDGRPDEIRGIREFVVGTGGATLYGFLRVEPNSEARGAAWGVIRFTLRAAGYAWEFVPVQGATFRDSGAGECH